ncbi:Short-chain dehydrogenase/reductase SDR [Neorhizobium galegae bv. officinalis]|nr:Short-chain dehydrogenase/reductase SDR [Neorhizobium galegae bv. officinalis]
MNHATLVTGGASGIGFSIAQALLERGDFVIIADVQETNLTEARSNLESHAERVRFERIDVTDEDNVRASFDACESDFATITGLVNSAGIGAEALALETDVKLFRKILEVNLLGSFITAKEAGRRMQAGGRGSIVNIASVSGIRASASRTAYGSSKAGMIMMTQVMALELASHGVRVNAIAPGPIETAMVKEMHSDRTRQQWFSRVPMGRYGLPSEMTGAALFLLDDQSSSYMTGQVLVLDGGFSTTGLLASG